MADNKVLNVSKGVARGHILCCCAVVFVCFMLTCLNLYMMSSTRSVLRRLDARIDGHPRNLKRTQQPQLQQLPEEAAAAMLQRGLEQQLGQQLGQQLEQQLGQQLGQQLQPQASDDFILLAPGDLDNAWTTQTGRLLVPMGQPDQDDDGWKQMQVQLAEQTSAQQRHIENLHGKLEDQLRAREELQRDQHNLMREHHELSREHLRELAKQDRKLLKEKHRVIKQDAKHQDELRRVKSEVEELKKVVEAVKTLDPVQDAESLSPSADAAAPLMDIAVVAQNERAEAPASPTTEAATGPTGATVTAEDAGDKPHPLEHIFSAVFGPDPNTFFFPGYTVGAAKAEAERAPRTRRGLGGSGLRALKERREEQRDRLVSRLKGRRRRHNKEDAPLMRIDDGQLVPLSPINTPVFLGEADRGVRQRRLARYG